MAVVTTKSTAVAAYDTLPQSLIPVKLCGGSVKESVGIVEAVSGDSIGSVYRFARVKSNDRISRVLLSSDAITTCAGDIGLYDLTSVGTGAAIDVDLFASAASLATAQVNADVTHEADAADAGTGFGLADSEKQIWQLIGLTSDPNKYYDVAITLTAAAGSAGTIVLKVQSIDGN